MSTTFNRGPVPKEALEYFRAKGMKPAFSHLDVWREEHASAFTVAKAMNLDVLTDIRTELDKALAEGKTFAQFKKELQPKLTERGWWGKGEVADPLTGKKRTAQLGSPRRLKLIYDTNMRTARAAGQWERIERTKSSHPFLLYQLGPSEHHRPEHVGFHGLLLSVEDSFWNTHMPPNGYGCKCRVRQVSKVEAKRLEKDGIRAGEPEQEINPDTGLPTGHLKQSSIPVRTEAPQLPTREWVNKRTGEVHQVPLGCDPGWDYNPGMQSRLAKNLELTTEKLDAAPSTIATATSRSLVQGPSFEQWARDPRGDFPLAVLPEADAALVKAEVTTVRLSADTMGKQRQKHPELTMEEYAMVQAGIDRGERIQDSPTGLIYILEDAGYVSVIKATRTGKALFMTSLRRLSQEDAKRDRELKRLRAKKK